MRLTNEATLPTERHIRFERVLPVAQDAAWRAIAEAEGIEKWIGCNADLVPAVGGRIRIDLTEEDPFWVS